MPFQYIPPKEPHVPILLSIPHCGTHIPQELGIHGNTCPDTDWFLEQLYNFADTLGIGMIYATHARYVVDLNRNPSSTPLYTDGRIITDAIPLQRFDGQSLYDQPPSQTEREERIEKYFLPYHNEVQTKLSELKTEFGWALLFDAHSIKRHVPTIQSAPFPDFILGNNDQKSAGTLFIQEAWDFLSTSKYNATHNTPFKGGFITRSFGDPENNIHALQLEMAQDLYLDEKKPFWCPEKAKDVQNFLKSFLTHLTQIKP